MSTKECLNNVTNITAKNNALNIPNALTAVYTYDLCVDDKGIKIFDTSNIAAGDSIQKMTVKITEGVTTLSLSSSPGETMLEMPLAAFPLSGTVRIDYTLETANGLVNIAEPVFIDSSKDHETLGSSNPNCPPLRAKTRGEFDGDNSCIYIHTQAVPALVWNVNHNCGVIQPSSVQMYNAAGQSMFVSVTPVDANNLTITFFNAIGGVGHFIFKL